MTESSAALWRSAVAYMTGRPAEQAFAVATLEAGWPREAAPSAADLEAVLGACPAGPDTARRLVHMTYALAAALSQTYKVGKVIVYDDDEGFALRFSVEALVSPEIFYRDLPRYLDIVTEMIADFFDTAAGEDGE